ncbi:MAG: SAM-dependent DNA methyltransferase, partial [Polyangiaceae bacterium]|nr:SAM-dependent DNA methyltransferase [Polyangiaceae bacterium]
EAGLDRGVRRAQGTHFTPRAITERVVARALDALELGEREVASIRVLDPAMGAGAFLCEALRQIVGRAGLRDTPEARKQVALQSLCGVDKDAAAVRAARESLWAAVGDPSLDPAAFDATLIAGDALFDSPFRGETFDLVIGNPPFLGGKRIRTVHGDAYADALVALHPPANKNTDLAAHFLRLGFDRLRPGGVIAYVVTNTIAQGDTREGGLAEVVRGGGTIFAAERRVPWPGVAGVVVSLLWIRRGGVPGPRMLDGREVPTIDAFLSEHDRRSDPERLAENRDRAFIGCFLRGKGFIFDDRASDATPLAVMRSILERRPESKEVVFPFLGGEEVLADPEQRPHRWVIHFGDRTEAEARQRFPELFEIVERKVRPFREARDATQADKVHARTWWRFANRRPELEEKKRGLDRVIGLPRMSSNVVAAFLPSHFVCSDQLVVVASSSPAVLALLSSSVHEAWTRLFASTLGDGIRYTPSDVFETFPLPTATFAELEAHPGLCEAGAAFDGVRSRTLRELGIGITALLGRIARGDTEGEAGKVARAKRALDEAVLRAYGWQDLALARESREILQRLFERGAGLLAGQVLDAAPL